MFIFLINFLKKLKKSIIHQKKRICKKGRREKKEKKIELK